MSKEYFGIKMYKDGAEYLPVPVKELEALGLSSDEIGAVIRTRSEACYTEDYKTYRDHCCGEGIGIDVD